MTTIRYAARLDWPHPITPAEQRRSRYTFKATFGQTLELLRHELDFIGADQALVELAVRSQDVLRSGEGLRSNAPNPSQPGVSLTVRAETGVRVFATDVCELWQHNLRSIALGLESLRAVSRYGITPRGEQYAGFLAIESGRPAAMTPQVAARLLVEMSDADPVTFDLVRQVMRDVELRKQLYRQAAVNHHPDRGGDAAAFTRLSEAMTLLNQEL
jgi:hypothetical protein